MRNRLLLGAVLAIAWAVVAVALGDSPDSRPDPDPRSAAPAETAPGPRARRLGERHRSDRPGDRQHGAEAQPVAHRTGG